MEKQNRRSWSKEIKLEIIKRHLEEHISVKELGKIYAADYSMIAKWVRNYSKHGEIALERKKTGDKFAAIHTSKSLSENERLKLMIAKQEIEIARLKKGYTVKGDGAKKEFVIIKDMNSK